MNRINSRCWVPLACLVLVPLWATGCRSLHDEAKAASSLLGVQFIVQASDDDPCAQDMFALWTSDYEKLSDTQKAAFKTALQQKFSSIVINPTQTTMHATESWVTLRYLAELGTEVRATKTLVDPDTSTVRVGTEPKTVIAQNGKSESITCQLETEHVTEENWTTNSRDVYDSITDYQALIALSSIPYDSSRYVDLGMDSYSHDYQSCSGYPSLSDFAPIPPPDDPISAPVSGPVLDPALPKPDLTDLAPNRMSYEDADAYCRGLGYRLPTVLELVGYAESHGALGTSKESKGIDVEIEGRVDDGHGRRKVHFFYYPGGYRSGGADYDLWSSTMPFDHVTARYMLGAASGGIWVQDLSAGDLSLDPALAGVRCVR